MKFMISAALSCLNSGFMLARTRAAAACNLALRSFLTWVRIGVIMIFFALLAEGNIAAGDNAPGYADMIG